MGGWRKGGVQAAKTEGAAEQDSQPLRKLFLLAFSHQGWEGESVSPGVWCMCVHACLNDCGPTPEHPLGRSGGRK